MILRRSQTAGAMMAVALHCAMVAQKQPSGALLVLSKQQRQLSIVDAVSLHVLGTVPVGDDPDEVVVTPDGTVAYVSDGGSGSHNGIVMVDLVARKQLGTIDTSALPGPHGLALAKGHLWFTAESVKAVARFDPVTRKVETIVETGQSHAHRILVSPDEREILATDADAGTLAVLTRMARAVPRRAVSNAVSGGTVQHPRVPEPQDPETLEARPASAEWTEATIPVGRGSGPFDVSPDGREIWVANALEGTVTILDRTSHAVVATFSASLKGATDLKFTPDGARVLISGLASPDVIVVDALTRKIRGRIAVGHGAAQLVLQRDGQRAFVTCTSSDDVAVVDLKTLRVTARILAGRGPVGVALTP